MKSSAIFKGMGCVKECPKNEADVIKSSNRLNCGTDDYENNQYICVPNKDKSSLVELCYNGTIGLREKGMTRNLTINFIWIYVYTYFRCEVNT